MRALVVVAHPDDETIFMGGYILKNPDWRWTVISVTHSLESVRGREFKKACERLGATPLMMGQEDAFEKSLDGNSIEIYLRGIEPQSFDMVFTHNQHGEYGHPHHITVHHAVKKVFGRPYFFGYNTFSDMDIKLNAWEFDRKKRILSECYISQSSKPFIRLFDIAIERFISPMYVEASIEAAFFGKNDIWSYETSAYELARIEKIAEAAKVLNAKTVLEVGAHEGTLTKKLSEFAEVVAFERSEVALSRGLKNVPSAKWILGNFENESAEIHKIGADVIVLSEVIYYFDDYKHVLASLKGFRYVITQNVAKIHKQVEEFMLEQGWKAKVSARSNPFGLAVYERLFE